MSKVNSGRWVYSMMVTSSADLRTRSKASRCSRLFTIRVSDSWAEA